MEFCPRCGSVLVEKRKNFGCINCNYTAKGKVKIEANEKMKEATQVGVIKDKDTDVFPVINNTCPKCGHREAYFWTGQMRAGDEAETRFFKCTKCKHTWREYH